VAAFCPPKGGRPRDSPLGAERPEVHTEVHLDAQTKGGGRICICLPGSSGSGALVQQHMQTWSSPEHHSPLKPAGFRVFCRWRGRRPLLFAELILANSTRFQLVWAFFVVVVGSWLGDPITNYKKDPGRSRSKRSPNGTDLRTPNRQTAPLARCTGNPIEVLVPDTSRGGRAKRALLTPRRAPGAPKCARRPYNDTQEIAKSFWSYSYGCLS
jgi:hypothetical protein